MAVPKEEDRPGQDPQDPGVTGDFPGDKTGTGAQGGGGGGGLPVGKLGKLFSNNWFRGGVGGLLGGLGGKSRAQQSKEPTRTIVTPPSQLGGWDRLKEIMDKMGTAPQYRVGESNPYLAGGMSHIMGRAGIATPEGGYGPNPYIMPTGGGPPTAVPPPAGIPPGKKKLP